MKSSENQKVPETIIKSEGLLMFARVLNGNIGQKYTKYF